MKASTERTGSRPDQDVRGVRLLTVANAAILLQGLLVGPLQAQALGPEGRGLLAAIVVPLTVLQAVAGLGLYQAASWLVASRRATPAQTLGSVGLMLLAASMFLWLLAVPASSFFSEGETVVATTILIGLLVSPAITVLWAPAGVAAGLGDWKTTALVRLVAAALVVVGAALLFVTDHFTVAAMAALTIASGAVPIVVLLPTIRAAWRPVFVPAIAKRALSYGSRAWLATLAGLVNVRLDQLVLVPLVSARELGLYAVAVNANMLLSPLSGAIATVATTRVAREGSASSSASIGRHAVLLLTLLVLVLGATVPFLLPLVFGADFHDAVVLAEILVPGTLALSVAAVLGSIAAGLGAPGIASTGEIGALAITIVGLGVLVPLGGAIAAAAVSTAAYTVNLGIQAILLRRKLGISASDLLVPRRSDLPAVTSMLRQAIRR